MRGRVQAWFACRRASASRTAALAAFLLWISLVGPAIHVVEAIIGLMISIGVGGYVLWRLTHLNRIVVRAPISGASSTHKDGG